MASHRVKVLHVDDSPEETRLLELLLQTEPDLESVGFRHGTTGLLEELARIHVDVLVIDLGLRHDDPFAAITEVHAKFPDLRIVVYSGYSDPAWIARAKAAGAAEYVVKTSEISEVMAAIRRTPETRRPAANGG